MEEISNFNPDMNENLIYRITFHHIWTLSYILFNKIHELFVKSYYKYWFEGKI